MKKVTFAWITEIIDFDNHKEAINFILKNQDKGWLFTDYQPNVYIQKPFSFEEDYESKMEKYLDKFISHTEPKDGTIYCFNNKEVKEFWTIEVRKPYRKYNSGW